MISGKGDRRGKVLLWSVLVSAAFHLATLVALLALVAHLIVIKEGLPETVSQITPLRIEQRMVQKPHATPQPQHVVRQPVVPHPVRQPKPAARAAAPPQPHEIAKIVPHANRPEPPHSSSVSRLAAQLAAQERDFGKEVAGLNKQDDPHAIPTIAPSSQQPATKAYHFDVSEMQGESSGNGLITPTKRWHDHGEDCYNGRYEYQYGDGHMETGDIVWPFCYDPVSDPFNKPPHPIPFPPPLPGYRLPAGTDLPHLEAEVYKDWSAAQDPAP